MKLLDCIPNISEGRSLTTLSACRDAIRAGGARLLNQHTSASAHRTVFTFVGTSLQIQEAVLGLAQVCSRLIDMRHHDGVHPRVGALDVCPLVPLDPSLQKEAKGLAHTLGFELAQRFSLPVILYEESAAREENRFLPLIRRGEFEALNDRMTQKILIPDYGPSIPHSSLGVTVLGVRPPLIAFNFTLSIPSLEIAEKLAKAIRTTGNGVRFPKLRAIGWYLEESNSAQVSCNFLNYQETSLYQVVDALEALAQEEGAEIVGSELVGLLPREALGPRDQWARLKLPDRLYTHPEEFILEEAIAYAISEPSPLWPPSTEYGKR